MMVLRVKEKKTNEQIGFQIPGKHLAVVGVIRILFGAIGAERVDHRRCEINLPASR